MMVLMTDTFDHSLENVHHDMIRNRGVIAGVCKGAPWDAVKLAAGVVYSFVADHHLIT